MFLVLACNTGINSSIPANVSNVVVFELPYLGANGGDTPKMYGTVYTCATSPALAGFDAALCESRFFIYHVSQVQREII